MSDGNDVVANKAPDVGLELEKRRELKGHFGKVYDCHWAPDSGHILSTAEDGKLLIWNAHTTNKEEVFPLKSTWVMSCAYAPSGDFVASGGLDNAVSVYKVNLDEDDGIDKLGPIKVMPGHEGYISSITFIDDSNVLSASGDNTCIKWDVNNSKKVLTFEHHSADVSALALSKDGKTFLTSSLDHTCALWDPRVSQTPQKQFHEHKKEVNDIQYFPDGNSFASASSDKTCILWDIRSEKPITTFTSNDSSNVGSITFSRSGKYLISGNESGDCIVWNTVTAEIVQTLKGHGDAICSVEVSPDGSALMTASWDSSILIWA